MREKRFFSPQIFFQPVLALSGKKAIPRKLGPLVGLPNVVDFFSGKVRAVKWNVASFHRI